MKSLLVVLLFVSVISYCAVDFTAPVINLYNEDENKSLTTNGSFRIMVDVDDDEATCLWEQTSGPEAVDTFYGKPLPISKRVSWDLCNLAFYETTEPGEMSFLLTVTDKRGRSSTMTIPITVVQGASLKVCKNGTKEMVTDSYGHWCCSEDMSMFYPNDPNATVMDIKSSCP